VSDETAIEWTDHTFNPWWGCSRVSPACVNCYADTLAHRYGHSLWHRKGPRKMLSDANWAKPFKWNRDAERAGRPARVFCASMADVFELHPESEVNAQLDAARERLWELIGATPWLRWQLLTKRIENVAGMVPWGSTWPGNVWLGTSVENQRYADERIPELLKLPAVVRFLSCEPLLGPVDLTRVVYADGGGAPLDVVNGRHGVPGVWSAAAQRVDWVIAGGESGPKHRLMDLDWVRVLRIQCANAGVPFLFKQVGGRTSKAGGRELDGRTHDEYPALTTGGAS
jgi:protein gp37